jgi:hypothetical protein
MKSNTAEHPSVEILSLYSAGDLPLLLRFHTGRHVRECPACEQQVLSLHSAKVELRREAHGEILTGFEAIADWHALESDMLGNIRVGVAASRCIEKVGRAHSFVSRLAWGFGMTALFAAGWISRMPPEDNQRIILALRRAVGLEQPAFNGTVVRSTRDGITVRAQGATLTFLHPQSAVVSMSSPASVTARYIDDDSGQVTITNVYGQ